MTEREIYERELRERQRKHLESINSGGRPWKPCMHDQCSRCHGTGVTQWGVCIHAIACDCPKCNPLSMTTTHGVHTTGYLQVIDGPKPPGLDWEEK